MSKSLFDNLQSALNNHAVVMSAANAQQKAETDSAYDKQISTLRHYGFVKGFFREISRFA